VHALASEHGLIAIEQPEIHLHPALQAELADAFLESADLGTVDDDGVPDGGATFLLETHSEHLLLRIMRRIRETTDGTLPEGKRPIRPTDVAVLYVDPKGANGASIVREMPLDERGNLIKPWPGGFFEEGMREMF
jgi:predicted ATPase